MGESGEDLGSRPAMSAGVFKRAHEGRIVALVGAGASGKSTVVERLVEEFESVLPVRRMHFGRPLGLSLKFLRFFGRTDSRQTDSTPGYARTANGLVGVSRALALAAARTFVARRAARQARRGYLVISDRWANSIAGGTDGPRMVVGEESGLRRLAATIEKQLYLKIPPADLCVHLRVDEETAVLRNRARVRVVEATEGGTRGRHARSQEMLPKASRTVDFDNSGSLEDSIEELTDMLRAEIVMQGLK